MKLKSGWEKVPSVTTGGKSFFYYHTVKFLWIVWDRRELAWRIKNVDNATVKGSNDVTLFSSPQSAMLQC